MHFHFLASSDWIVAELYIIPHICCYTYTFFDEWCCDLSAHIAYLMFIYFFLTEAFASFFLKVSTCVKYSNILWQLLQHILLLFLAQAVNFPKITYTLMYLKLSMNSELDICLMMFFKFTLFQYVYIPVFLLIFNPSGYC